MDMKVAFVRNELLRYREAQRWMWTVLMVFVIVKASTELGTDVSRDGLEDRSLLYYLAFLVIVYRFFVGDSRILDYLYDSVPAALAENPESEQKFIDYVRYIRAPILVYDGVFRVCQLVILAIAAFFLTQPPEFAIAITVLLLFNAAVCLLFFCFRRWFQPDGLLQLISDTAGPAQLPLADIRLGWFKNNLAFGVLLVLVIGAKAAEFPEAGGVEASLDLGEDLLVVILLFLNSGFDLFGRARELYVPDFGKAFG